MHSLSMRQFQRWVRQSKGSFLMLGVLAATSSTHAFPLESIGVAVGKLFKGGIAVREAGTAARSAEISGAWTLEHAAPTAESKLLSPAAISHQIEPGPAFNIDPTAASVKDLNVYRRLRKEAEAGDSNAMCQMADLIHSRRVTDSGEPRYGYWLFSATRLGSTNCRDSVSRECTKRTDIRTKDYWFDIGCRLAVDGKTYFRGSAEKVYGIGPKAFQGVARDTQGNMLRKIGEEKL